MRGRGVHLVGSVPLEDAAAVFREAGQRLGTRLERIPDGETGIRSNWIAWQKRAFAEQRALVESEAWERDYQLAPPFGFAPGRGADVGDHLKARIFDHFGERACHAGTA